MRVLMLVATTVATDTRVLREATTLAEAGHVVHIIGRSVPPDYRPPAGVTVSSVGTSSVFRAEGVSSLTGRSLSRPVRFARWLLLPRHRRSAFGRWAAGAVADGRTRQYDAVHAHDFTALPAGAELAQARGVPLVYDTHELWFGRPREHRPTPLLDRVERAQEARLGGSAAAVITVGDGVAQALRRRYGWSAVVVVRNTFPAAAGLAGRPDVGTGRIGPDLSDQPDVSPAEPTGLIYAGRLAAYRELETIAAASHHIALPVSLIGPADTTWLAGFDPGRAVIHPPCPPDQVDEWLTRAGLVLVTHSDRWENHRLAMPNKLFHAVRAGVPVVATDVGELAKVVRRYDLGTLYPPGDAAGLVRAVEAAVGDYPRFCAAVRRAAPDLSWPADARRLLDIYADLRPADVGAGPSSTVA